MYTNGSSHSKPPLPPNTTTTPKTTSRQLNANDVFFDARAQPLPGHIQNDSDEDDLMAENFAIDFDESQYQYHVRRSLIWDDSSHWKILTQMYGSVWPRVLPYCLINMGSTWALSYLKHFRGQDWTMDPSGHKYASTLMAFLLVSRLSITLRRYMENSMHLHKLLRSCRDLVATACLVTAQETSRRAKQWRQDVAFGALIVLRVAVAVLQFRSNPSQHPWRLPEVALEFEEESTICSFHDVVKQDHVRSHRSMRRMQDGNEYDDDLFEITSNGSSAGLFKARLAHVQDDERKEMEEMCRAPYVLAFNVRADLMKHRDGSWFHKPVDLISELRFLQLLSDMLESISGLFKLVITPIPFPLVQMNKVFLYAWLFTLPLAIAHENYDTDKARGAHFPLFAMMVIAMITFGFMGIEYVSIELTDNFGSDPSDFDVLGLAHLCIEDCYMCVYQQDGKAWAHALKKRLTARTENSSSPL